MSTWKNRFNELSTKHSKALEEVKAAKTKDQWNIATSNVKTTMHAISRFLTKYESAGSPNHDDEMPND
jgi:hypothetical protein